jgi:hypothetical protein
LAGTVNLLERWLALSSNARHEMGERGKECFAIHFDIRGSAAKLIDLIRIRVNGSREQLSELANSPGRLPNG